MSVPQNQTATNIIKAQISDLKRRAAENVPMLQAEVEHLRSAVEPIYTQNDALATPQTRARMDTANKVSVVLAPEGEAQRPVCGYPSIFFKIRLIYTLDRPTRRQKPQSQRVAEHTWRGSILTKAVATVTQWEKQCQGRENDPVGTQLITSSGLTGLKKKTVFSSRSSKRRKTQTAKYGLPPVQDWAQYSVQAVKTVARWEKQCQDLKDGHAVTRSVLAYHFNEEKRLQIERQCHLLNANRDPFIKAMETAARWEKQCQDLKSNYAVAQSSAKDADQLRAQLEQDMRRLIILEAENGKLKAQKETLDAEKATLASELATQASDILQLREVVELLQASLKHAESVDTKVAASLALSRRVLTSSRIARSWNSRTKPFPPSKQFFFVFRHKSLEVIEHEASQQPPLGESRWLVPGTSVLMYCVGVPRQPR
ncbi:hypothetical protein C8R43DRAFT_943208 [Mycena crocata]|nr:hypothetical protein C8R43DRAFT_943208 [Mycena crocata]